MTDFAGRWDVTLDTMIGKMKATFDITEEGGVLKGVASSDAETVEFLDPVVDGNRLTWRQAVTTPMKLTLTFDVTVDGDTMTGASKAGLMPAGKVHAVRSAAG